MLAFQPIDNWETLVAFVVVVLVGGVVLVVVLARDRVTHRVRVGFFVDREVEQNDDDDG